MLAARSKVGSTETADDGTTKTVVRVPRDLTLDLVKGMLVIIMVVYHTMNIFSTAGPEEYAYVRFISGSFVLLSGYIVARFNEAQFKASRWVTSRRLVARGFKLLVLFTALNLLINMSGVGNPGKLQPGIRHFLSTLFEVYVTGNPRYASFQILLPISYLLIVAPAFLSLGSVSVWAFAASCAAAGVVSSAAIPSVNLEFTVLGAIGLSGGLLVNRVKRPLCLRDRWSAAGGLLAAVLAMRYMNANLATYALGTIIILKLLYDLGQATRANGRWAQALILLGQYSLFCYIAQIIFMQVLHRELSRPRWDLGFETMLVMLVTLAILLGLSALVAGLSSRYRLMAKMYRMVFA
jgi:hypothetical protein